MSSLLDSLVEVRIGEEGDFLKIKETLTRIGIASRKERKLFQSCHILHKQGRYYIVHFKELFALDGKSSNLSDEDVSRRNTIANLLQDWGLLKVVDPASKDNLALLSGIKILSHKEKNEWELVAKYNIGKKKRDP
jgi:hypothetical protein